MERFVAIAEVVKAVGLRGEVKLYPLLDFHEPLLESGYLDWDDGTQAVFDRHRSSGGTVVVKPNGVSDRTGAEALIGRLLGFDREVYLAEDFPRPATGLPFRYLERQVEMPDGEIVGTVDEVRFAGSNYLLVLQDGKREILIPAVEPILRPDTGLVGNLVIDPPEGLLDVQS